MLTKKHVENEGDARNGGDAGGDAEASNVSGNAEASIVGSENAAGASKYGS